VGSKNRKTAEVHFFISNSGFVKIIEAKKLGKHSTAKEQCDTLMTT